MSEYRGEYTPAKVVRLFFNTAKNAGTGADGTPITLAGTPAISVYKDGGTTESTTGVTLTVDFDARTGLHLAAIDTSADGTFYSAGSDFEVVITTGTVNGISIVGTTVGKFSLSNRAGLRPVTADRTLAVDASGRTDLGSWLGGTIPAVNVAGVPLVDLKYTLGTLSPAAAGSVRADAVTGAVGSVTGNVTGSVGSVASFGTLVADIWAYATRTLTAFSFSVNVASSGIDTGAITAAELNAIADAILDRSMSAGVDSGTNSTVTRTVRQALRILRNKVTIAAGVMTATKEDDTTTSWTAAITTTAGNPISVVDPT